MLDNIRIILIETSHGGNIGATARAMKNMGLSDLVLVNPKQTPNEEAFSLASGAENILDEALIVNTLDEALEGVSFVVGTSARTRKMQIPILTIRESAKTIIKEAQNIDNNGYGQSCAIIFGRERNGLENNELLKCHEHAYIPTNPEHSSLNLSQAVQLFTYEIRQSFLELSPKTTIIPTALKASRVKKATSENIEAMYQHWEEMMKFIDFTKDGKDELLNQRIRRMFQRTQLEEVEVNVLRGICSKIIDLSQINK